VLLCLLVFAERKDKPAKVPNPRHHLKTAPSDAVAQICRHLASCCSLGCFPFLLFSSPHSQILKPNARIDELESELDRVR
jgi:hypothetical protein